ncbi:type VI secretion system Vgr family protein [Desulfatitalea tepidiphila]|uniref:type VI secretion system Vgr family protein n=1 Tax=Desulfatitalea tepidiphila TaxID=1185843 RepID=UPI0006B4507E|nr:type VI secretion system tip protein TssI/VgrG [Desulfatitalea tepidiphila]
MTQLKEAAFTFESQALPKDAFTVVRFSGEEGLSRLYRFDILLVSERSDIDITAVLQQPATFTIRGKFAHGPDLPYHGILSAFEQQQQYGPYIYYRAELRPRLWWLTLTHHNQVFLDKKIDQFLSGVLQDGGLSQGVDFDFRFQGKYEPRPYVCQYGESHFDFVSRWMEREGAYYWFEQGGQSEKMIAADTHIAHTPLPGHETFVYAPPSGLDATGADKVIRQFNLKQRPMPKNVLLKDYNYLKPSLDLEGRAPVQANGRGEIYLYGEHFQDRGEGQRLADIRAEAYRCREKIFHGRSTIPAIRPGYLYTLQRHYSPDFNRRFLTTAVRHEGSQEFYLASGLGSSAGEDKEGLFYRNSFECIPGDTQFRPERTTPKPRISGTLSARIDAAGSGQYAELDEHGRYKVVMPFDLSGRKGGKASAWVRMMQPYAGEGMGFHAPLHKGTEVLLSFIEADPDRPVIAGAVPNPETPSPVNDANQTQVRLVSGSGNIMHMEDQEGRQRILLHSPSARTFLRLGAPNDPDTGDRQGSWLDPSRKKDKQQDHRLDDIEEKNEAQDKRLDEGKEKDKKQDERLDDIEEKDEKQDERLDELETEWGARLYTDKALKIQAGGENALIMGECVETILGADIGIKVITADEFIGGLKTELMLGGVGSYHFPTKCVLGKSEEKILESKLHALEQSTTVSGNITVVAEEEEEVVNQRVQVTLSQESLQNALTEVINEQLRAVNDRIGAVESDILAVQTDITTAGTKIDALNSRVLAVNTAIKSAATTLIEGGVTNENVATKLGNFGTSIDSIATLAIREGTLIVDG